MISYQIRFFPQRRRLPKEALQGVVLGQQRLGVNLVSLMVTLREEGRLPIRIIQWYLETVHQLHLSVGTIVQAVHGVARQAETAVREVLEQVRASPVVQGDETGWRQDGSNGYVWTFSTPSERYFLRRGRDKGVVDEVLDSSFSGVLVSDFYAAQRMASPPLGRTHRIDRVLSDKRSLRAPPLLVNRS